MSKFTSGRSADDSFTTPVISDVIVIVIVAELIAVIVIRFIVGRVKVSVNVRPAGPAWTACIAR